MVLKKHKQTQGAMNPMWFGNAGKSIKALSLIFQERVCISLNVYLISLMKNSQLIFIFKSVLYYCQSSSKFYIASYISLYILLLELT